jgi:ABC-type amino acid transport substrate-binding protein
VKHPRDPRNLRRSIWILALGATACGFPRDPDGTLDRVRGGVLRVGYSENAGWISDTGGVERAMVNELAASLGAHVEWTRGSESPLFEKLHKRELDLVVAGLTDDGSWARLAAPTKSFYTEPGTLKRHVWATSPGENAWLVEVEHFLREQRATMPARLGQERTR